MKIPTQVANPNHEAWRWRNVKKKTDRADGLKLAKLSAVGQLPLVHMPSARVRRWRSLIAYRQVLVDRRTSVKSLEQVEQKLTELAQADDRCSCLQTAPSPAAAERFRFIFDSTAKGGRATNADSGGGTPPGSAASEMARQSYEPNPGFPARGPANN